MRSHALLALSLLVAGLAGPVASGDHTTTFRFDLANGETVALRLNLTAGEWPVVQATWWACADDEGVPASITQTRYANTLHDAGAALQHVGGSSAIRVSHDQDGYIGIGATSHDSGGISLEARCTSWEHSAVWSGPNSETRFYTSTGDDARLYLTVRDSDAIASMDAARFQATLLTRRDFQGWAQLQAQAHWMELSADAGSNVYLSFPGRFVGWLAGGPAQGSLDGDATGGCQPYQGRCDVAGGIATFSDDTPSAPGNRLRLGLGTHAAARDAVGYVAAIIPVPEGYAQVDRTAPTTFVEDVNRRPDGTFPVGAEVHLKAVDDLSGVMHTHVSWSDPYYSSQPYVQPFVFDSPGTRCFYGWSKDFWGNEEGFVRHCVTIA